MGRTVRSLLWVSIAHFTASCASELAQSEPVRGGADQAISVPAQVDEVQLPGTAEVSYILTVPCGIDDRHGKCVFDTGASGVFVHSCFAEISQRWSENTKTIGGSGAETEYEHRRIHKFAVGPVEFENILAQLVEARDCSQTLGLVGLDLFKKRLFINMDHQLLTEESMGILLGQTFDRIGNLMAVDVFLNGTKLRAVIDSGAQTSFIDAATLQKAAPSLPNRFQKSLKASDVHGDAMNIQKVVHANLKIAGLDVDDVSMAAIDLVPLSKNFDSPVDLILGMNAIQRLNWGFDFEHGTWGASSRSTHE